MITKYPQLVQLNVRIKKDLYKEFKIFCFQRDAKLEEFLPIAIKDYMANAQKADEKGKSKKESLI